MRCCQPSALIFETSSNFRGVPSGLVVSQARSAFKPTTYADQFGQLADRDVFAAADVDDLRAVVFLEQENAGGGGSST